MDTVFKDFPAFLLSEHSKSYTPAAPGWVESYPGHDRAGRGMFSTHGHVRLNLSPVAHLRVRHKDLPIRKV